MPQNDISALGQEWTTLQNNHEAYERSSLLIKLFAIALLVACIAIELDAVTTGLLMLVMWIQEGIFRTSQSRIGERILRIESLLKQAAPQTPIAYQLHSEWQASRPGFLGLLVEYGRSMVRPTVAFPHLVLILFVIAWPMLG
ncbi:hypothetical protein [Noviherbaspirillum pedocola]|uniref:Uncharacterized protein n=1 Tax=Noviherbaspirillum pedocola TaxID=2801341 RepID=A0A934W6M4_9BURK|nr:hypothetical protein [Noviherbaspirillum pedocola]MBK4735295.1 hypothetical protein [Noviherbaspirillum pedocola]